jgi:hypothetical protein
MESFLVPGFPLRAKRIQHFTLPRHLRNCVLSTKRSACEPTGSQITGRREAYVFRSWSYPAIAVARRFFRLSYHSIFHPHSSHSCCDFNSLPFHAGSRFGRLIPVRRLQPTWYPGRLNPGYAIHDYHPQTRFDIRVPFFLSPLTLLFPPFGR